MTVEWKKFMNIWEIEGHFKCPVVGAMLSVEKHRRILKKCGWDVNRLKPYEYHSHLMGCLGDENPVSVKVNNFIRHQAGKYMKEIARLYADGDGKKVRALWDAYSAQGVIGPVMYAIVSHADADVDLLQDIHGEVHMQAHANMTEVFEVRKRLRTADEALAREKKKLGDARGRIRGMLDRQKGEARETEGLRAENRRLRQALDRLEDRTGAGSNPELEKRLKALEHELGAERNRRIRAEKDVKQAQIELFSARNENDLVRKEIQTLVTSMSPHGAGELEPVGGQDAEERADRCPARGNCSEETCPNYQLCAKRVFMIGGITKMKAYYRDIVEKAGGQFDYHDGYLKNSNANLAAKVKRCDVVVCPVNCNSHNACLRVKKLCQQYNKKLMILNSASLSAVTQALFVPESAQIN